MASNRTIRTIEDVLRLLDGRFATDADRWSDRGAAWWDRFYADRDRQVPFFRAAPDESLVGWQQAGLLGPGEGRRALDLGCGPGRNAVWLAAQGYRVDAIDLSPAALEWGRERAAAAAVPVTFIRGDVFVRGGLSIRDDVAAWTPDPAGYHLVYDSGCFHHLPPHRRISYRSLLEECLLPGGVFGLACFAAGAMGCEEPDESCYRQGSLSGGLAYTDQDLREIFGWLQELELRRMSAQPSSGPLFGEEFLWAGLFRRKVTTGR